MMSASGEEAATVGLGYALFITDPVFPQYRESAALRSRGFPLEKWVNHLFGNKHDESKGKNAPTLIAAKKYHWVSGSAPLCTQVPQAVVAGIRQ